MHLRKGTFREPKITDPGIHFTTYHATVMAVMRSLGLDITGDQSAPIIRLMELDEDLPGYDESEEKDEETGNKPYIDKTATALYFDASAQIWKKDESQQKATVCNPYTLGYTKGVRMPFLYLAQSEKFIPMLPGGGKAKHIRFRVKTAFSITDDTIEGQYIIGFDGTDPVEVDEDIEIQNDGGVFRGNPGLFGFAEYSPETDTYHCYQLGCASTGGQCY